MGSRIYEVKIKCWRFITLMYGNAAIAHNERRHLKDALEISLNRWCIHTTSDTWVPVRFIHCVWQLGQQLFLVRLPWGVIIDVGKPIIHLRITCWGPLTGTYVSRKVRKYGTSQRMQGGNVTSTFLAVVSFLCIYIKGKTKNLDKPLGVFRSDYADRITRVSTANIPGVSQNDQNVPILDRTLWSIDISKGPSALARKLFSGTS